MDTTPTATETAKQYLVEAAKQHTEATRCHPYHTPAEGLSEMWGERTLDMRQGGCQKRRLLPTIGKWPAISVAERRAGIAQCYLSQLTGKLIEEEQQLSAAVMIGGNSYKATIDTGVTASFVSEEMADNIAALGRITRVVR